MPTDFVADFRILAEDFDWPVNQVGKVDDALRTKAVFVVTVASSRLCWRNWERPAITPHDGAVRSTHPTVERALGRLHSTTSLRRLLRDPLGFLWRYGLGWRSLELDQQPLALSPATFGELVHELLRRTINSLEPAPGFGRASRAEIEVSLEAAVGVVSDAWPLERAVPPSLLWRHTLDEAARRSLRGLTLDDAFQAGTRSWTELSFGQSGQAERVDAPWEAGREVQIPNTGVHFGGRIDRVDIRAGGTAVRISDYKAGEAPRNAHRIIIAQAKRFSKEVAKGTKRARNSLQQLVLEGLRQELDAMVPLVKQVMKQTRTRIFRGDTHAEGKILSLFEPSTEIIRKGKAGKPNEFGKMVKLQEAEDQIVIDYEVYDRRPSDSDLLIAAIEMHRAMLGRPPHMVAADAAFYSAKNEAAASAQGVKRVCIPNRSTKSPERKREQRKRWFRNGQKWRTGCEGRISVVKRRHGLDRCRYKGDAGMKRWVGLGVIADNVVNIGRTMEKQSVQ